MFWPSCKWSYCYHYYYYYCHLMIKIHNLKIITFNKIIIIIIMKKNQMVSNYVKYLILLITILSSLTRMMVIFGSTRSPTIYTKLITKGSRGDGFTVMVKILPFLPLMVISKWQIMTHSKRRGKHFYVYLFLRMTVKFINFYAQRLNFMAVYG